MGENELGQTRKDILNMNCASVRSGCVFVLFYSWPWVLYRLFTILSTLSYSNAVGEGLPIFPLLRFQANVVHIKCYFQNEWDKIGSILWGLFWDLNIF